MSRNCVLKHFIEGKAVGRLEVTIRQEEDVSNCSVALRKGQDTGN